MGLYIAAGIVHLHEGCKVWATSPGVGQGTTFFVQFPVAEAPPSDDQALDILLQETPRVAQPSSSIPAARRLSNRVENLNILIAVRERC